jgi:Domain of Unknown Function (DUF1206)
VADATAGQEVRDDAHEAKYNPVLRSGARFGFTVSGLLQLLVGVFAVQIALGGGGQRPDQSGAFAGIAKAPGGGILLWAAALACALLAIWLVVSSVLRHGGPRRWFQRAADWGRAALYVVIGFQAVRFALGSGTSSASSEQRGSGELLSLPGGPVVLLLVAAVAAAIGVNLFVRGVRRGFREDLDLPSGKPGVLVLTLGVVGFVARGLAIVGVGVLIGVAAVTADPGKATGLDGALRALAAVPVGRVALVGIGAGWVVSGVYFFVLARRARMT